MSGATDTFVALMSGEYAARSRKETPEAYLEWKGGRVACTALQRSAAVSQAARLRRGGLRDVACPVRLIRSWRS